MRSVLRILSEKALIKHKEDGPRYIYYPAEPTENARDDMLAHVVRTYFAGSPEQAAAALSCDAADLWVLDHPTGARDASEGLRRVARYAGGPEDWHSALPMDAAYPTSRSWMIGFRPSGAISRRASVIGSLKRRRPALPGFR